MIADPLQVLPPGWTIRRRVRQELLGDADGAERVGDQVGLTSSHHLDQLHTAAADIEHDAVAQGRGVYRRHIAVVSLVVGRQDLDVVAGRCIDPLEVLVLVAGVTDRAGGDHVDVIAAQAGGAAEAVEHDQRLESAVHRRLREGSGSAHTLADPHGLIELVGLLPPLGGRVGLVAVDHQAPRIGAEVDHRDLAWS